MDVNQTFTNYELMMENLFYPIYPARIIITGPSEGGKKIFYQIKVWNYSMILQKNIFSSFYHLSSKVFINRNS